MSLDFNVFEHTDRYDQCGGFHQPLDPNPLPFVFGVSKTLKVERNIPEACLLNINF